jgi:hypothetical protein
LGAVDGGFTLTGGQPKLTATNLRLNVKSAQGLVIDGTGGVGYIGVAKELPVRDIDINLTASAPDLRTLPIATGWDFPEFGPLEASVRLGGAEKCVEARNY